jgi:hypothetical protein
VVDDGWTPATWTCSSYGSKEEATFPTITIIIIIGGSFKVKAQSS